MRVCIVCAGAGAGAAGAELLPRVLDKVFAALVFEQHAHAHAAHAQPPHARRSRSVKNVRRHAAGLLVKLGSKVCTLCTILLLLVSKYGHI